MNTERMHAEYREFRYGQALMCSEFAKEWWWVRAWYMYVKYRGLNVFEWPVRALYMYFKYR